MFPLRDNFLISSISLSVFFFSFYRAHIHELSSFPINLIPVFRRSSPSSLHTVPFLFPFPCTCEGDVPFPPARAFVFKTHCPSKTPSVFFFPLNFSSLPVVPVLICHFPTTGLFSPLVSTSPSQQLTLGPFSLPPLLSVHRLVIFPFRRMVRLSVEIDKDSSLHMVPVSLKSKLRNRPDFLFLLVSPPP